MSRHLCALRYYRRSTGRVKVALDPSSKARARFALAAGCAKTRRPPTPARDKIDQSHPGRPAAPRNFHGSEVTSRADRARVLLDLAGESAKFEPRGAIAADRASHLDTKPFICGITFAAGKLIYSRRARARADAAPSERQGLLERRRDTILLTTSTRSSTFRVDPNPANSLSYMPTPSQRTY